MKNLMTIALLAAALAAPAFADDAAKADQKKPAAQPMMKMHDHKSMKKDQCDEAEHPDMHGHGMGMMMGRESGMMMEPDMHLLHALNLTDDQRAKVTKIADELKHDNWATQGLLNDESARLRDLYEAEQRDVPAISAEYQKVFDLKRKMIETYLNAQNRIEDVLTPEQRAQMKDLRQKMRPMYEHMY